jgi:hypothetical protein
VSLWDKISRKGDAKGYKESLYISSASGEAEQQATGNWLIDN